MWIHCGMNQNTKSTVQWSSPRWHFHKFVASIEKRVETITANSTDNDDNTGQEDDNTTDGWIADVAGRAGMTFDLTHLHGACAEQASGLEVMAASHDRFGLRPRPWLVGSPFAFGHVQLDGIGVRMGFSPSLTSGYLETPRPSDVSHIHIIVWSRPICEMELIGSTNRL
ncbi:hypothetical protein J6590_020718 [Homalodisca vitripennis]|nr:hypothetical protein J6590_020718 [Homalodisca vitripennis]